MSRYALQPLPSLDYRAEIVIGYDRPLATFHLTVEDLDEQDDDKRMRLWEGGEWRAHRDVAAIIEMAAVYAVIPDDLAEKLRADLANGDRSGPPGILAALRRE